MQSATAHSGFIVRTHKHTQLHSTLQKHQRKREGSVECVDRNSGVGNSEEVTSTAARRIGWRPPE